MSTCAYSYDTFAVASIVSMAQYQDLFLPKKKDFLLISKTISVTTGL